MAKQPTIREQVAILMTENKGQTEKIDRLIDTLDKHEESSNEYRQQTIVNSESIRNIKKESLPTLKKAIYALYGLIGGALVVFLGSLLIKAFIK